MKHILYAYPSHTGSLFGLKNTMRENQGARELKTLEEDLGAIILMARGAQTHPFENLIKAMDHSLPRKIHIPLCMVYPQQFYTHIRGRKDPCNLSTELLGINRPCYGPPPHTKDIHDPESMFLTAKETNIIVSEGSCGLPTSPERNPCPEAAHL